MTLLRRAGHHASGFSALLYASANFWQFFSGMAYYQPRQPCDAIQIGRLRRLIGEACVEQLLKTTVKTALEIKAIKNTGFKRVLADSTVQEKAVAHPTDSRPLEVARAKIVRLAEQAGVALKQAHEREDKKLRPRQRTVLGIVLREVGCKMSSLSDLTQAALASWREGAGRIHSQRRQDTCKLYALHAPRSSASARPRPASPSSSASRSAWRWPTRAA